MFDVELVKSILIQIEEALEKIKIRSANIEDVSFFTDSPYGMEKLDGICMLLMATGESLKSIDKITNGSLLKKYPEVDWTGVKGFRDIVAHHYFDIDAEQVYWIISKKIVPLSKTINKILKDLKD
jgi:uncharacterized protein with HEPN domain